MGLFNKTQDITIPKHIAIILDGNGRWAKKRGLPRTEGHRAGVENIRTVTLAASDMGIKALSFYAFSTENWRRPKNEVNYLMKLPGEFEKRFKDDFDDYDIKVMFSGRKNKMSKKNLEVLNRIEENTKDRQGLVLNICFDYGSKHELVEACKTLTKKVVNKTMDIEEIDEAKIENELYTKDLPPLDLLIRPGGETRLSNFMLWQAAYAELYFCDTYWPAFSKKKLRMAVKDFNRRERRFGDVKG